jgi:hypothetical protein
MVAFLNPCSWNTSSPCSPYLVWQLFLCMVYPVRQEVRLQKFIFIFTSSTYFKLNNQIQIICNVTLTYEKNGKLLLYKMKDKVQVNTDARNSSPFWAYYLRIFLNSGTDGMYTLTVPLPFYWLNCVLIFSARSTVFNNVYVLPDFQYLVMTEFR